MAHASNDRCERCAAPVPTFADGRDLYAPDARMTRKRFCSERCRSTAEKARARARKRATTEGTPK
jgi:hypothetical protein